MSIKSSHSKCNAKNNYELKTHKKSLIWDTRVNTKENENLNKILLYSYDDIYKIAKHVEEFNAIEEGLKDLYNNIKNQ
jgi:hypothetical protein